jgi:hypothetical protein
MSRRHVEHCTGELDCRHCQARIDDAEFPDPGADSDWQVGLSRYEAFLDGGSR